MSETYYYIDGDARTELLGAIAASKRPQTTSKLGTEKASSSFVAGVRFIGFVTLVAWDTTYEGYTWKIAKGSSFVADGSEQSGELGLAYSLDGAESRATGSTVALFRTRDTAGLPVNIFIPPEYAVVVKITSAASGGGKYNGRIFTNKASDVSASGTLAASDLGGLPGSDDAIILDMSAVGSTGHDLMDAANTAGFYFIGHIIRVNADGKKVVAINGFYFGCDEETALEDWS